MDEQDTSSNSRQKRSFYETLSNFTRTSVYNLFNWAKLSVSTSTNKNEDNVMKNVTPHVDNEVQEPPLPIPRVRFRKVIEHIPESTCKKCTSSHRHHHRVRVDDLFDMAPILTLFEFFSSTMTQKRREWLKNV